MRSSFQPTITSPPYPYSFICLHTESHSIHSLFYLCFPAKLELCIIPKTRFFDQEAMATATATTSLATIITAAAGSRKAFLRRTKVNYICGLRSFGGLKAQNNVVSLGLPLSTEESFAKIVSSLNYPSQRKGRGGGALSSTCNKVDEIFQIAAIISGLVLIGVAVGFVLLRVEASLEEAE